MTADLQGVKETARYKIFLNKTDKHVIILRFPHLERDRPFTEARHSKPLKIRLKPKNGLVEADVPLPDMSHLNRQLAVQYGMAVNQHKAATNGAPVGIAGGFGASNPVRVKRQQQQQQQQQVENDKEEVLLADFDASMESGKALNFLTLTGQIKPFKATDPSYYLGNFQGDELHLTKVSAFCSLSVGLQHLDAQDLNEKASRRAAAAAAAAGGQDDDAAGGAGGGPVDKAAIVGMQVKSADESKTEESEWKRVLRELQEEPWQRLDWIDEAEQESFDIFHDKLFLGQQDKANRIAAVMTRQQYLDSISAPRIGPVMQDRRVRRDGTLADDGDLDTASDSSD